MRQFVAQILLVLGLFSLPACAYMHNPMRRETHLLQRGITIDTTSFIYHLPYPPGVRHTLVQGYFTQFTHKRRAALDFKMPRGSVICAARGGVVVRVKEDGSKGGIGKNSRRHANYLIIQHADSTRAGYWHLSHKGALVQPGDSVQAGQPIALSGNTGYTYFPHLHFIVWGRNSQGGWIQIPTRFYTADGVRYLKAIKSYQHPVDQAEAGR
ncbi:M23 family metallopeptidase [Niabella terrae]